MTHLSSEAERLASRLLVNGLTMDEEVVVAALLRRIPELEAELKQLAKQAASMRSHLTDALAFLLCEKDGNDDPHHLIWEGGAIPEPWGEVWQKYLPDAESLAEAAFKSANDWGLAFDEAEAQALDDAIAERDQLRAIVEGRAAGCQCGDDDVCKIVKERDQLLSALKDLVDVMSESMGTGGWVPSPLHSSFLHAMISAKQALPPATQGSEE